jgi:pimeloyl-ACP methyl ester carboxylesterase
MHRPYPCAATSGSVCGYRPAHGHSPPPPRAARPRRRHGRGARRAVRRVGRAALGGVRPAGFECARLDVPLDRSGRVAGTVTLNATRVRAAANPGAVAVVALAGGPGQAAAPLAPDFAQVLAPALASRDLLVFDQRGTGRSSSLDCRALRTARTVDQLTSRCAAQLGPARASSRPSRPWRTSRRCGSRAATSASCSTACPTARRWRWPTRPPIPDRVESLLLDSVVLPEGPDAFQRSSWPPPRARRELCAGDACRGATGLRGPRPGAADRPPRAPLALGPVFSSSGRRYTARLTEPGLAGILLAGDLNPALRASCPAPSARRSPATSSRSCA